MRTRSVLALTAWGLALGIGALGAADWPQFRGPDRSGVSKETGLLKTWPPAGPTKVYQSDKAGQGYAGMAVVGGIVYTMGARDKDEYLIALDAKGQEKWATKIGPVHDWKANAWSRGPNGTPTVDGDLVYCVGSQGVLICVEKEGGKQVWNKDLPKDLSAEVNPIGGGPEKIGWGYCWSPIVDGDVLVIPAGGPKGLIAGLDKKKGVELWRSKGAPDQATYASPVVATIGGVKQYIYVVQTGVVGVSAKDGELLWRHKRDDEYSDIVCATPIVKGDLVYVSVGYGGGSICFKLKPDGKKVKAEVVYEEKAIGNKQGGVVLVNGFLYGFNEDRSWACQNFETGKLTWPNKRQSLKAGQILAADGRLYVVDEAAQGIPGTVAMLEASNKAFKVISLFKLPAASKLRKPRGGVWAMPSISDGKLYLRDQELVFCYEVK